MQEKKLRYLAGNTVTVWEGKLLVAASLFRNSDADSISVMFPSEGSFKEESDCLIHVATPADPEVMTQYFSASIQCPIRFFRPWGIRLPPPVIFNGPVKTGAAHIPSPEWVSVLSHLN